MTGRVFRWATSAATMVSLLALASIQPAQAQTKDFNVAAQSAITGIPEFARQAGIQILVAEPLVRGKRIAPVTGSHTISEALAILLKGTGLIATSEDGATYTLAVVPLGPTSRNSAAETSALAASRTSSPTTQQSLSGPVGNDKSEVELVEVLVTGTHIRGVTDSASPVLIYTRDDIDAAGTITVQQFLQTLPQNFGGASENTIGSIAARGRTNNSVNGSAPNLRGLGAEATLVLVNGHRVAPGDGAGDFVDISMIPLAAVERIEIVTDGASAIYGSDAVGGVVNIILRSKFEGAESRALFGSVGTGSMHNVQAAQTVGDAWSTGSAVLSYQYSDQTPLSAGSRDYLHSVLLPFDLLPEQVQHAAFANVYQEIRPGFDVHGDAMYSHRATSSVFSENAGSFGNFFFDYPSKIDAYGASLASTVALPRQSKLAVAVTYSESDTSQQQFDAPPAGAPLASSVKTKSTLASLDVNVDGVLAAVPAGLIHYAVGAQYRRESFGNTYFFPPTDNTFYPARNVGGGYIEMRIPVLGQGSGSHGDPALELTVADRAEHYSDFGATNNPQVGAIWKPLSGLTIRSTYGTSFKAPLLSDLNPIPFQVVPFPGTIFNPAPGGTPNTLIVNGGNPALKPEKATVWTVGLDLKPQEIAGLNAKLTYYDIVFKDEIANAQSSVSVLNVFADEAILGPEIVQRNPPSSLVQQFISAPSYENPFKVDPATIGAIFDSRSLNLSTVKTRGLDFGVGYKADLLGGLIDTGVDGTYIFAFENKFTNNAPIKSFLNTPYNPTDLRLRGRASVALGPVNTGLYINFTNAYVDTGVVPNGHVSSWTTADAVLSYEFGSTQGPPHGVSVAFSVTNLTDRDPPYVSSPTGFKITYDGVNANALGRFFSLRLQKRW